MKDDEHIEIETKKEIYKPIYSLRKEDFAPLFIGLYKHHKRCLEESSNFKLSDDSYASQCWIRDCGLLFYNFGTLAVAGAGIAGLVSLLSK